MQLAYSLHLSGKKHALSTKKSVQQASKHNLRLYRSAEYDRENVVVIRGSQTSVYMDLQKKYHEIFDSALKDYNDRQRPERRIEDYLDHVDGSRSDVAVEMIIEIGDKEFWDTKSAEEKSAMVEVYKDQILALEKECPGFKIISAVVHLDETSPHIHIIGIPVADDYEKGMELQVAKTRVFTKESLSRLQEKMHEHAEREVKAHPEIFGREAEIKPSEKGRNFDLPKEVMREYKELKRESAALKKEKSELGKDIQHLQTEKGTLQRDIGLAKNELASCTERLLSEKEAEDLRKKTDRSLKTILEGGTVTVTMPYKTAMALERSELTEEALSSRERTLDERSAELAVREKKIAAEVEKKVEARLPARIKEVETYIPQIEDLAEREKRVSFREKALQRERAAFEKYKETLLKRADRALEIIKKERHKIVDRMLEKLQEPAKRIVSDFIALEERVLEKIAKSMEFFERVGAKVSEEEIIEQKIDEVMATTEEKDLTREEDGIFHEL